MAASKNQVEKTIEALKNQEGIEAFWDKVQAALRLLGECEFNAQTARAALEAAIDFYQKSSGQKQKAKK